ncbi:Dehydrogenase/reductase SDR family member 12 [Frankliniella fusca]|uniref:Dehydrogenase/reductase SDR family member 12 n=1 Tax=Frankliniella fusca TaxID=407009 RepID=A0AAE1LRW8_9NEOP|nr:Dehydrogenase/reductase SDR family member 12 [Frankliniella fusca]
MTLYRKYVWFVKGLREYTKSGYQSASKNFNDGDLDVDCSGKVFMITGANSGIGESVAQQVAKCGGTVHMVCRNAQTAEDAKARMIEKTDNKNIHLHILDLAAPQEVYKFAKAFVENHKKLDVLVNNAGCMVHDRRIDSFGNEYNFATNVLSPHILTRLLTPLLLQSEHGRVIMVTSGGMLLEKLDADDPQLLKQEPFDGVRSYAQNKRQMVVMAEQYAEETPNVFFASAHPGWADTPSVRSALPDFHKRMEGRLRSSEEGADTISWLAVSQTALTQGNGKFFQDRSPVNAHLPLAWTHSTKEEVLKFISYLDTLMDKVKS